MSNLPMPAGTPFSFRVNRAFKAMDDGSRQKWVLVVPARELPPNLPLDANARVPNVLKNPTCVEMRETLLKTPELFQVLNGGMVCTASAIEIKQEGNTHVAYITFDQDEQQGIVNGGHTYACLVHVLQDNSTFAEGKSLKAVLPNDARKGTTGLDELIASDESLAERIAIARDRAQVQIEVVAPVATAELLGQIARARNLSQSVEATALANLAGKFEVMKRVLASAAPPFGPGFVDRVVWKTNQEVPEDGPKISVKLLIQMLALMNIRAYPPEGRVASGVYARSGVIVREFSEAEGDMERFYQALARLLPHFIRLYDAICETLPQLDPMYPWADGRIGTDRRPRSARTPFFGHICPSKVANAFVWPVFSAFRALLHEDAATGEIWFFDDPFPLFEEMKQEIVGKLQSFHRNQANGMIQMVGKDKEIWLRLDSQVEMALKVRVARGISPQPLHASLEVELPAASKHIGSVRDDHEEGPFAKAVIAAEGTALDFPDDPRVLMARNVTDKYLSILSWAYSRHTAQFAGVSLVRGRHRIYFSRSPEDIEASGIQTSPKQIPGTPYWATTNNSTPKKKEILMEVLCDVLDYDRGEASRALTCLEDQ